MPTDPMNLAARWAEYGGRSMPFTVTVTLEERDAIVSALSAMAQPDALAAARRAGAEEMRGMAANHLRTKAQRMIERGNAFAGAAFSCEASAILALPLPGDTP